MHPSNDSLFLIGTDKGSLKLSDLRISSNFNDAIGFNTEKIVNKNFFTDIVCSYSSSQFIKSGKYVAARDYLNVRIWDITNATKPLMTIPVQ